MKPLVLSILLPYLVSTAFAEGGFQVITQDATSPRQDRYIVEFESPENILNNFKRDGETAHEHFYRQLQERGVKIEFQKEYNVPDLFVGVSLTVTSEEEAAALHALEGVKAVRPVVQFEVPKLVNSRVVSPEMTTFQSSGAQSSHVATGVDKVHTTGNFGQNIKVAIIDTGIDYKHRDLGGGIGPNFTVIGGHDFVGDRYGGTPATMLPDEDPMDCHGHGTSVAGVLAAHPGGPFNISGVAPGASITSYKVYGCSDKTTDEVIIDALLRGVEEGQDIITISIAVAIGWSQSTLSVIASRVVQSGTVVIVGAGNAGEFGSWYAASPAAGDKIISVGSTDNTVSIIQTALIKDNLHDPIPYWSSQPLQIPPDLPIFVISTNTDIADDACKELPDATPDLSDYLVIVRRGKCEIADKLWNISYKGGRFALVYNNNIGFSEPQGKNSPDFPIPAALIPAADGLWLVEQYINGKDVRISFPQEGANIEWPDPRGGLMSLTSSYGPTFDARLFPSVSAPGGNILCLLPRKDGGYAVQSGTSFSTPFVAGAAALLLAAKGRDVIPVVDIGTRLQQTAKPLVASHASNALLQTLNLQGTGQIDIKAAITSDTFVSPAVMMLNDTARFKGVQSFTVYNRGNKSQTYTLTHVPAGTANSFDKPGGAVLAGPVPLNNAYVSVNLSYTTFTISAGKQKAITARFTASPDWDPALLPIYSGLIKVTCPRDSVQVAYMGIGGSLKSIKVLATSNEPLGRATPYLFSVSGVQLGPKTYSYKRGANDWPSILWRLAFGTASVVIDLVLPNISIPNVIITQRDESGTSDSLDFIGSQTTSGSFARIKTVGNIYTTSYANRHASTGYTRFDLVTPTFSNGSFIPNGEYKFLIRALRVYGEKTKQDDYDSWLSPPLTFNVTRP